MRTALYRAAQWIWGFPQTAAGAVLALCLRRNPRFPYRGAVVTLWDRPGSLSLGMFLFLSRGVDGVGERSIAGPGALILRHEYGHTLQSLLLGPLFLLVIGVPSLTWAGSKRLARLRREKHIGYYSLYTERWANRLGGVKELR